MPLLFSYGSLQDEQVQVSTFGRRLSGERDVLPGYEPSRVAIDDPAIVAALGRTHHANVVFNGRDDSVVSGTALTVTDAELALADRFEEAYYYERVAVTLASAREAWLYVDSPAMRRAAATALLLVDVQQGLDHPRWGARNNPDAEQRIADLLAAFRSSGRPVIHVQHLSLEPLSPLRQDSPGHVFKPEALPLAGEPVFQKHVNSAFIGTDLEAHLRAHRIDTLVVAGITTDHCVSTTVRMAGNLGFSVIVIEDATATFERIGPDGTHYPADLMHRAALASLHGEFATVRSARDQIDALTA